MKTKCPSKNSDSLSHRSNLNKAIPIFFENTQILLVLVIITDWTYSFGVPTMVCCVLLTPAKSQTPYPDSPALSHVGYWHGGS